MRCVRSTLRAAAITWLFVQVAAIAAAPVVLANHASEVDVDCTCTHGPNAICPMHHKPGPGAKVCAIGGMDDSVGVLASLFHAIGLMPASTEIAVVAPIPLPSLTSARFASHHPVPPDPPPPRT
jgi:hypothetical protein